MDLSTLEDIVKQRLSDAAASQSLKLKVETYGGQLDDDLLANIVQNCPCVWVVISGLTLKRPMTRGGEYAVTVTVLAAAASLNDDMARKGGRGGKHTGAYNLVNFVGAVLNGFGVDPTNTLLSQALRATGVQNLFNAKIGRSYLAIYGVPFQGRLIWLNEELSSLDDLVTINHATTPVSAAGENTDIPPTETELPQKENRETET